MVSSPPNNPGALAEELSETRSTVLLTFDQDMPNQAARNAPTVSVHVLTLYR
jgi:hypothetical protein